MKPAWLSSLLQRTAELVTCPALNFCFRNVQKCGFIVQIQLRTQHAIIKLRWLQHSSTTQKKFDFPHKMCLIYGLTINKIGWKGPSGGYLVHSPVPWDYQLSGICPVWTSPKQVISPPLGNLTMNTLPTPFTQNFSCWLWLSGAHFHCGFIQYMNFFIRKPLNPQFSSAEL